MKSLFIESFKKLDKKFIYVILLDFLFYAFLLIVFIIFSKLLLWSVGSLSALPGKLIAMSEMGNLEQLGSNAESAALLLNQFKSKIVLSLVLFWFMIVLAFTLFKGAAWSFVTKQKIGKELCTYVFKFNLIWFGIFALLGMGLFFVTKPAVTGIVLIILFLIMLYLTPLSYALFNPKKSLKDLPKRVWHVAVERIYLFILPILLSCAILVGLWIIAIGIMTRFLPGIVFVSAMIIFIVWQSWFKYYIYDVARKIK
jgi:hypothetical protein